MNTAVLVHAVTVATLLTLSSRPVLGQYPTQNVPHVPSSRGVEGYYRPMISVTFEDVSLRQALQTIADRAGLPLLYEDRAITAKMRVRLRLDNVTIDSALKLVTRGLQIDARLSVDRGSILIRRISASQDSIAKQVGTIIGRVIDTVTREPVSNATVILQGTKLWTTTDSTGRFGFYNIPARTHTLVIQRIGYTALKRIVVVPPGNAVGVDVAVNLIVSHLEEVVATATGGQRRAEVGNTISTIKADSLVANGPITSLTDLLAARAPGVQVLRAGGSVGAPSRIRIRGVNSAVLNNDPIVVVDGVRINAITTTGSGGQNQASGKTVPSPIDYLDPNSIESIDILKGPSASSLYGTDAANGVIVIKTKRGQAGPARFTIRGDQGWSYLPDKFPEAYYGIGSSDLTPVQNTNCTIETSSLGQCVLERVVTINPMNDKLTTTQGTGHLTRLYADVAGGWTALQYYLGGTLDHSLGTTRLSQIERRRVLEQQGFVPKWQQRPNGMKSVNLTGRLNAYPTRQLALQATSQVLTNDSWDAQSGFDAATFSAIRYLDSLYFRPGDAFATRAGTSRQRALASTGATYLHGQWLAVRGTLGMDYEIRTDKSHTEPAANCTTVLGCSDGYFRKYDTRTTDRTADLSTSLTIPLHRQLIARTTIGGQYNRSRMSGITISATGTVPGSGSTSGALNVNLPGEVSDDAATAGWYIEEQFSVNDRLFLTAGVRQDVGSAFGQDASAPTYPKVSGSWMVSRERFLAPIRMISNLRLRAAYGHSGKQPRLTDVLRLYQPVQAYANGRIGPGLVPLHLGNTALRPERGKELEGGVDLGLFGDRILVEASAYRKVIHDALYGRVAAPSVGSTLLLQTERPYIRSMRYENLGSVENRGFELGVTGRLFTGNTFSWDVTINASANRNRVLRVATDTVQFGTPDQLVREGYPLFGQWRRPLLGYQDRDENGILTRSEIVLGDTAVYMGAPYPKSEISYSNTVQLLNGKVRVNALFQNTNGLATLRYRLDTDRGVVDPTAPLAEQARALASYLNESFDGGHTVSSSGYRQTVDWLRLAEFSVTYLLPASFVKPLRTRMASVSLLGRNLGMWTRYRGMDPEVNSAISQGDTQLDNGSLIPQTREWTIRVNLAY